VQDRPQDPPLPEPIPASYYAPAGAPAGGFAWPAAHVLVGWALVGGLVACVVLLFVLSRTSPPRAGGVATVRSLPPSPPVAAAPPPAPVEPSPEAPTPTPTSVPTPTPTPVPTPSPTAASVTILNGPLDGHPNRSVTLLARTAPRTACTIDLGYPSAPDLDPATSDASGAVSWTWRVGRSVPEGSWPVTVTCGAARAATRIVVM